VVAKVETVAPKVEILKKTPAKVAAKSATNTAKKPVGRPATKSAVVKAVKTEMVEKAPIIETPAQ
jgi:hypothetical protein